MNTSKRKSKAPFTLWWGILTMKNVESIQNISKGCRVDIHKSFMCGPSFNVFLNNIVM